MTSSTPKIIDGIQLARDIRQEIHREIEEWTAKGNRKPKLVIILVGSDKASNTFTQRKIEAAENAGIEVSRQILSSDISEKEVLDLIETLNNDDSVDGFFVQLPVPAHINKSKIANAISCDKDVDGFNAKNIGKLCFELDTFVPCVALSVREIIKRNQIETHGKNAVIVGTSKNFGMPIAIMMQNEETDNDACGAAATVTMCNLNTPSEELKNLCKNADILISVTGQVGVITADMVKEGSCVIDVGGKYVDVEGETKYLGDVDFDAVKHKVAVITPVPGGVGPVTIAMLMKNTVKAAKILAAKKQNF